MNLSREHLDPNNGDFAFNKISFLEMAEKLDPKLMPILWDELSAGNYIWNAGRDFPSEGSLYVSLSHPFTKTYMPPKGVTYAEEKDPHYNTASYITEGPLQHALCAPFKK
jgi:hypothetical protein